MTRPRCLLNLQTASHFISAFAKSDLPKLVSCCDTSADELVERFNSTCTDILDSIAPFGLRRCRCPSEPWINDSIRALRGACRRVERKWKDRLYISLGILRDCLFKYQCALKHAKTKYFSTLIAKNSHRPQVLFKVLNNLITPCVSSGFIPFDLFCEK